MAARIALVTLILSTVPAEQADAQRRYPRVVGSTGRYYGPTQAHAQYQRRYGTSWPGHRPLTVPRRHSRNVTVVVPWAPFVPTFGGPFAPIQYYTPPVFLNGAGYFGPYAGGFFDPWSVPVAPPLTLGYGFQQQWIGTNLGVASTVSSGSLITTKPAPPVMAAIPEPAPAKVQEIEPGPVNVKVAAAGDRVAAIRFQAEGDVLLRSRNYNRAYSMYRASLTSDPSRPQAYYRLAFLFTAMQRYEPAIRYLKQGLDFAPKFPRSGDRLDTVYGPKHDAMKQQHVESVLEWAQQSPDSPDRQLLAGAMLHFNDQPGEAAELLERAARISQRPSRAIALLAASDPEPAAIPDPTESLILEPDQPLEIPAAPVLPDPVVPPTPTEGQTPVPQPKK